MIEQVPKKLKRLQPRQENSKSIRVLCVEDTEIIRETMVELLKVYGYRVASAKNGQEGVEMTLRWKPDVILMDIRMPIMSGYDAIHEIKFNPQTHHIPIFAVSAWSGKKERDQARLVGADEFFVKPPDFNRLSEAIEVAVTASPKSSTKFVF
ncbi:MAG: response regulator [Anaerolineae bacterium]|nr:response regulator [Anaerolineae bacterium]